MDVERDDDSNYFDQQLASFPVFVVRQLSTLVGLKNLVEQTCWDLLYNADSYRKDYLEVEIFMRFLQEFYDQDDLLFFLYVRAVVAKTVHISFKRRWAKSESSGQPKTLWMSFREIILVSKTVFSATNESMLRNFLTIVSGQVVGQKTETNDSRRIEMSQFLHLAVVGYHQAQAIDGLQPPNPTSSPSQGVYMGSFGGYPTEGDQSSPSSSPRGMYGQDSRVTPSTTTSQQMAQQYGGFDFPRGKFV